jgi:CubicO group peptidase (beta-lactamase class C family)
MSCLSRWRNRLGCFALLGLLLRGAAADRFAAVTAGQQAFVERGELAGAVTLVAQGGEVRHLGAVGYRDLAARTPLRTDDLFWIASMTKPLAAVCVLLLQDEGRLRVDDPVEQHLPEFRGQRLVLEQAGDRLVLGKPARPITLRDLLTHTAGLGDAPAPRPDASLAELVAAYAHEPLQFPPGSRWSYSNPGINTLGRIVEVVSGQPFAEFLDRRLLRPLGMKDTTFWPTPAQAKRLAKSYKRDADGRLKEVPVFFVAGGLGDRTRTPFPAGGLFSTAADMVRPYQMLLARGVWKGRRLLSEAAVAELTRTQSGDLRTGFVDGMSWGYGFQVVKQPQGVTGMLSPGTFGHGGAYGTQSWGDPGRDAVFILMIQAAGLPNGDASPMRQAFQQAAADALRP